MMTEDEYRADLLAAAASRAETVSCSLREALTAEVLDRLRDADELPDAEPCAEALTGARGRKLEIDAFAFDEADDSLHLFVTLRNGGPSPAPVLTLTDAREQGFSRLLGVFEQSRDGWLGANIEESRPLSALAQRMRSNARLGALRLHVLTDRSISERVKEIPGDTTREGYRVTFQIWDLTRLKRIHDGQSARDDLVVDFSMLAGGGLPVLPAAVTDDAYAGYLAAVPADALAEIYARYGSRLLEGNVRTFLGRRGKVNRAIADTIAKEPARFFAYNNGIAATASAVKTTRAQQGTLMIVEATDLQIVNGAQTTASIASVPAERRASLASIFVPMKLSVVPPQVATEIVPLISRFANSQNAVRESDFFANHEFHQRIEEISRRLLAPAIDGSQVQSHWYYERARGQHLNDQAGMTPARKTQFLRMNPRNQVITKTDLAKVENCFALNADIACKGAEKSFTEFAEHIAGEWQDEGKRAGYGDDWFRFAVARTILFRAAEKLVSSADWYEGGYRAQIVAHTMARLTQLATERSNGGRLDYQRIWAGQAPSDTLEKQILAIAKVVVEVLQDPPQAGRNISEWAKQQACTKRVLQAKVPVIADFDAVLVARADDRSQRKDARAQGEMDRALAAVTLVMTHDAAFWRRVHEYGRKAGVISPEDVRAMHPALHKKAPTDIQAARISALLDRCREAGFEG